MALKDSLRSLNRRYFGSKDACAEEWRSYLRRKAKHYDIELVGNNFAWRDQELMKRGARHGLSGIPDVRCSVLQGIIKGLKAEGDVVECGVRYGKSAAYMIEADQAARTFHLFDSFEGLSEPEEADKIRDAAHWKKGDLAVPEKQLRQNLSFADNVRVYKGWIPDRFAEVQDQKFALLHVDVDFYRPTIDSLAFFWPRMALGGVFVCDDYGSPNCPGARQAVDEFFAEKGSVIELPTGQAVVVKTA